jgi:DNA-directed RNA polymerase specialized sigma24 family protein
MYDNIRRFRWQKAGEDSAADLLRECGQKLTDRALWTRFQDRFQGLIFLYLLRALNLRGIHEDTTDVVPDLAQEVYLRLVQHDGRILRTFRGATEFSVMAFLARISSSVVLDHLRAATSEKRRAQVVPLDSARMAEVNEPSSRASTELNSTPLSAILSWIDIERIVEGDPDRKNARRNALIFKLHYIDGFDSAEIARFPGFDLTQSGVETVLARLRKRIQNEPEI